MNRNYLHDAVILFVMYIYCCGFLFNLNQENTTLSSYEFGRDIRKQLFQNDG